MIPERLQSFLDTLDLMPGRAERIDFLIDVAERFREVPEEIDARPFDDKHRVPHCESEAFVWWRERPEGGLDYYFAVENPQGISARAMAVILGDALSGANSEEIAAVPADLPSLIFGDELSMGKSMGLMGMLQMVQSAARRAARQASV